MSPRTYSLITHPKYIDFVSESLARGLPLELTPFPAPRHEIPILNKAEDISLYIGISPELVWTLIKSPRYKYRRFPVKKRSGGFRIISSPRTYMKVVQWWILDAILETVPVSDRAFGFISGKNYVDNAREHHGATHILNVDLENFFPSTTFDMVKSVFREIGYSEEVSKGLASLTTYAGSLPQGAPTSPMLSNLVFRAYDSEINQICEKIGVKYTRYADDMTFSSVEPIPRDFHKVIEGVFAAGFKLNAAKTVYSGENRKKEVTGVTIGRDGPCLSRDKLNAIRGWVHAIEMNPKGHRHEFEKLQGTIAMVEMVGGRGSGKIIQNGKRALTSMKPHI